MSFRRAVVSGAAALALTAPAPATALSWGSSFRVEAPQSTDVSPVQLAVAPNGTLASAFSLYDEDAPNQSHAFLSLRSPGGHVERARRIPDAQQALSLVYDGATLDLLTAAGLGSQGCCAQASTQSFSAGRFGSSHRISRDLAGAADGELDLLPGHRLLATVASDRGVWVDQSAPGARFAAAHRISSASPAPWAMAAAEASGGHTSVGWVQAADRSGENAPEQLVVADGSAASRPGSARQLVSAPAGHELDELALAPRGAGFSVAWIESWFDQLGAYHSEPVVADVSRSVNARPMPVAGEAASGLTLAGAAGAQVLAFRACDRTGACRVWASYRSPGGRFSAPVRLGAVDPGQPPAAAVGPDGTAVVGWISGGQVFAVTRAPGAGPFSRLHRLSPTHYAADLTLASGPGGGAGPQAVAAWTQGTLGPSVVAAELG